MQINSLIVFVVVSIPQELPFKEPDIIVSTPVALLNYLYAIDSEKRGRTEFIRDVKYVVKFYLG